MARRPASKACEWPTLSEALSAFARNAQGHQGAGHIKPLHWYVACRLVVEGGFHPDEITPRPPLIVTRRGRRRLLSFNARCGGTGERAVLGGLKTKNVDVVVTKEGIGPVIAVSMKGTLNAFRNLTNRMEEAVGDCTNLHLVYPALVYGFLHVLRANRARAGVPDADVAIRQDGTVASSIRRYHDVLVRLTGRSDIRDDPSRYEAVSMPLVIPDPPSVGNVVASYPPRDSPLMLAHFFDTMYRQYDLRFIFAAMKLESVTRRHFWDRESSALADPRATGYAARIATEEEVAAIESQADADEPAEEGNDQ